MDTFCDINGKNMNVYKNITTTKKLDHVIIKMDNKN